MSIESLRRDIKALAQSSEKISKRLRRVEVLSRLSSVDTAETFIELDDTPNEYNGYAGWVPFVNGAETGLEFGPVGGACVAFVCGSPGWRATGGSPSRTLVHETAFQLSAGGDDRGEYAIDLQQVRFNDNDVAGGNFSSILGAEENEIIDNDGFSSEYSGILGSWNTIEDGYECYIVGTSNTIDGSAFPSSYQVNVVGSSMYDQYSNYVFLAGYNHNTENAFGCFALGEANEIEQKAASDNPTYSGATGILNDLEGDCYLVNVHGEENSAYGIGTVGNVTLWSEIHGFESYLCHVITNYAFGQGVRSYRPTGDGYYDGRIVFSGDYPNQWPAGSIPPLGTGAASTSGYNQDSWFSQNDFITDWPVAWTTSRFEFPIIQDSAWGFLAYINGVDQGLNNTYLWKIEGYVENNGGVMNIRLQTVTNLYRGVATKEWRISTTADRVIFQYRDTAGPDTTDVNIQFKMLTTECGYD
jgi:hypothetical protein